MLEKSALGKSTVYIETYSPELLFPIPRKLARDKIGLSEKIPFEGVDIWNGYEISWLNPKGKPELAMAVFYFPCNSENVIESKSFKLYLNSFNQSSFASFDDVKRILERDLSLAAKGSVSVDLFYPSQETIKNLSEFSGICLDSLDIETNIYQVDPKLLCAGSDTVKEKVYSHLLKSNCLATGQPDWGSVWIHYSGGQIDHERLLKYIVSYRRHSGFAEHCVEQIYCDIMNECCPTHLSVYARYTRRGGLDINPFRSNFEQHPENLPKIRQ